MEPENDVYIVHNVESLRRKPAYYWPAIHFAHCEFRPALNLRTLISSLDRQDEAAKDEEDKPSENENGRTLRKRKRVEAAPARSKRIKLDKAAANGVNENGRIVDDVQQLRPQIYPPFWETATAVINETQPTEDASFHPVYQFAVHLRYNKLVERNALYHVDDQAAANIGWVEQEEKLCSLLEARRRECAFPQDIHLGRIFIIRYVGRLLALAGPLQRLPLPCSPQQHSEDWLTLLPHVPWPDGLDEDILEEHGMPHSAMHHDFIAACAFLQSNHRTRLDANLHLHILPEGTYNPASDFPFELRVRFNLALAINPPINTLTPRKHDELDSLQRRLVSFLSKTPLTPSVVDGFAGDAADVTVPFFLRSMRPAPALPPDVNYEWLQPDGLLAALMPFQRRTVAWMLEREGKYITSAGLVAPIDNSDPSSKRLPVFWEETKLGGRPFFFNRLSGAFSLTFPEPHPALGGMLAEEPGLGKTMECLSLMLLNPAPGRNPTNKRWDPEAKLHVKEIKTTLIVTPPALAGQWADELATYAPDLKVFIYEGWAKIKVPITEGQIDLARAKKAGRRIKGKAKRSGKGKGDDTVGEARSESTHGDDADPDPIVDWAAYINRFDVCITTYTVLRSDISVARAPPDRPRRDTAAYKILPRTRSPLVTCEWYRVIMDEVQMMGTGKAEEMVSLIPRLSSFAVSGTPARAQVSDLISVLRFLRINDLVEPARIWDRILKHRFKDLFAALFQRYAVRTLKSSVTNELTIPQQKRYLVSIDLGRVERHVYDQTLEEALTELGLDARGVAASEGWDVDASILRNMLRRLRGICTHPQVGQLPRQGDRLAKSGALKSMADVLESMKDQNWRNLTEDRKAKILALTRLAQLQQHNADDLDRYQRALEYLLTAETEVVQLIDDIKACIAQHNLKGDALKEEAQTLRDPRRVNIPQDSTADNDNGKGKGRALEQDLSMDIDLDTEDEEDVENRGLPKTLAGEEHRIKRTALLSRLRECLMVLHRVKFLQGDVYHVLGSSHSDKEDAAYADAERLRKDLLKSTEEAANKAMRKLSVAATEKRVTEQALQIPLPFMVGGGIRSTRLFEEADEIIEEVLNEQSTLLWEWRTKIVELLTQKLSSSGEQADGEEYARTLDTQGEAEVFLQAYAALLADRREAIAAERTLLAAHEGKERKVRKTKAAARATMAQGSLEIPMDVDVQPQHEVLYQELLEKRKDVQPLNGRALKSVMVDLVSTAARVAKEDDPEKIIAREGSSRLRALIASHQELAEKLDADLSMLRKVFNDRIVYFRQLQEISDTVAEVEWDGSVVEALESTKLDHADLGARINTRRARQRYLDHLAMGGSNVDDDATICILCQCEFLRGFITQCAHIFCEGCMRAWIARGQGRACPVCRAPIDPSQLQRFTLQEDQPAPRKPVVLKDGEPVPTSSREIEYNMIDPNLFADIQTMESNGSYGSKIQTLVRHLLHIQIVDPGAKSIVFSAWADSLTILEHALGSNGIPSIRLDQTHGRGKDGAAKRFRIDPSLQVLLLHGERDNAGLNVTCASRVFLLESVVNHGFEIQAIARIDRLGQTRATEVFCYYAEDTVEKNILDLAARQGLSLYTKENSVGTLNVTSFATDAQKNLVDQSTKSAKKGQAAQKGDFIFKVDDMLAILFPHMYEDIEFLLPPDARGEEVECSASMQPGPVQVRPSVGRVHVNAEAGPSRLSAS